MSYSSAKRAGSLCAASIGSRASGSRFRAFTAFSAVRLSVWVMGREARKVTRPWGFLWDAKSSGEKLEGKLGKGKRLAFHQTGLRISWHARLNETLIPGEGLPRDSRREQLFGPDVPRPPGHHHRKLRLEWKRLRVIRRGHARRARERLGLSGCRLSGKRRRQLCDRIRHRRSAAGERGGRTPQ